MHAIASLPVGSKLHVGNKCASHEAFERGAIAGGTDRYRFGGNLISVTIDGRDGATTLLHFCFRARTFATTGIRAAASVMELMMKHSCRYLARSNDWFGGCIAFAALLLLEMLPAWGEAQDGKPYERVSVDPESGRTVLQFPVRRFERKDPPGPIITTHGMIHIADRQFYERHQELLDPLDVVLFEMVLPSGVGRPEYALQDTNSPLWKIETTKLRMQSLAAMCNSYARLQGKQPTSFRELQEWDPNLKAIASRLAKDCWGNDFHLATKEANHSGVGDSNASDIKAPTLEIISWGKDNAEGGTGESADIYLSEHGFIPIATNEQNSMIRTARSLGLMFQGEVEKHDRANFRSCDLSDDQVGERLLKQGEANVDKKNANAWMPQRLLETIAELAQVMPGLKNGGKQFFVDMLAESPIQSQVGEPDAFSKVILDDRNQVVIDDVNSILENEPNVRNIGIIYGAAHMPGIESKLMEMGYEETRVDWIDAIVVEPPKAPLEKKQLEASRTIIRSMGLLGGEESPGEKKRKRWRRSNTSEDALAQNYRKEIMREWIGELAKLLDADREAEREQAEGDLMKLGSIALPYLPASQEDDSDEFRMRIERIRGTLLDKDEERLSTPSRVTLSGPMTGRQALESIAEQSGNQLPLKNLEGVNQRIDIDIKDSLFWEALDELLDKLNMSISPEESEGLQFITRNEFMPQRFTNAGYSGSFRIEPVAITKTQSLYEPKLNATSLELALSWEPRLNPVFVRYELEGMELKCDNGEILRPKPNQGMDFTPSGSHLLSTIEFDRPTRAAREIVEWKGRFFCAIPGKPVAISFKDLENARNVNSSNGDLKVTLERSRKNRDLHEVLLGISIAGDKNTDSIQGWTSMIDAYLVDESGNRVEHAGWSTTRLTGRDIGLSFLFEVEESLNGYQFVFVAPQSIMQQNVEYTLSGIPLP